jgi:bifunctional DNA-binding transcriptional regulator/antitoxin component of YhaV-PrlF toxin-antitoxin module
LPKTLRQRLGVKAGSTFEASEAAGGILLQPIQKRPSLVERNGFLVHLGQATHSFDWRELFDDVEQQRLRDILGG